MAGLTEGPWPDYKGKEPNDKVMSMLFKRIRNKTSFLNQQKGFSQDEMPFEIRYDPLTGETGRVFDYPYEPPDRSNLVKETVQRSRETFCPFCAEALEESTPLFPKEFIPEGRIRKGKATLIPNIAPFDRYPAVSVLSEEHHIDIEDLTPERTADAFSAALSFIRRVVDFDPQVQFLSINWNYMPQSGSSIVHPHLQVTCGDIPTNHHRLQIEGYKRYLRENGTSFWEDFIRAEKDCMERYIGEIGSTFWVMSFVPHTFFPDVWCIFPETSSLIQLGESELHDFLEGLSRVLKYFGQHHIAAFNMSMFSVKKDKDARINARICPRLLPRPIGNSDRAYLQTIHKEASAFRLPESLCPEIREIFNRSSA